jgi:hypothetical protein
MKDIIEIDSLRDVDAEERNALWIQADPRTRPEVMQAVM